MPNKRYVKGRKKEYRVMNEAKEQGHVAFRSAGSHSPIDVIIINYRRRIIKLVQCKADTMPISQKDSLYDKYDKLTGRYEVFFEVE